ncbi:hypothetical protein [Lysobacter solisilvae (ex Woo and Kim 2020)]|uniref:Uncharacterized protein n=1 Tax=Agrilutibacter terrestris TaxID=2865112 RepID=A0A7H0G104_9GAMM|nr:hypothetical protein [Lysobacter terrestris]QNP41970.1 hypothetical protein H8B22_07190 [Lysobacter terrestris]
MKWMANSWQDLSPALRRYYRASVLPSVAFLVLALAHEWLSRQAEVGVPLRAAFALAPVLALAWLFAAYLHFLHDCDELERRIELGALAWAAGIAVHAVLAVLLLLDAGVVAWRAKHVAALLALVLVGSYALVRAWLHRRYA